MAPHPLAGRPAPADLLVDVARLERLLLRGPPDPADPPQRVSFGTSGHRGTPLDGTFTEAHILAITQAICEYRARPGHHGPAVSSARTRTPLSRPAERTALEVLAANGVDDGHPARRRLHADARRLARDPGPQRAAGRRAWPTASSSRRRTTRPADGGFKYNPPDGGPADTDVTELDPGPRQRAARAAATPACGGCRSSARAARGDDARARIWSSPTSTTCADVVDLERARRRRSSIGVDPLGGAVARLLAAASRERYGLDLTVVNPASIRRSRS